MSNACISYIMTSRNEKAEDLLRSIEREEEEELSRDPEKNLYHLCIVNLAIGTLYCSKGNYDFGIKRIIKGMDPYSRKLGTDTWYYAKRCFASMAIGLAKQIVTVHDDVLISTLEFLDQVDQHGTNIFVANESSDENNSMEAPNRTVSQEARMLKRLYLRLRG